MATKLQLSAVDGPQVIPIPGGAVGSTLFCLVFGTPPASGTVKVEWRAVGSTSWQQLRKVNGVSMPLGELAFRADGAISALRVTFAGLVGGASPVIWADTSPVPVEAFGGAAAITVQNYAELNSKQGSQFDITVYIPALAPNTKSYTLVTTGAFPISIKGRRVQFDSNGIQLGIYKTPTLIGTPGTPAIPFNLNDRNPRSPLVSIRGGITAAQVSSVGTLWRPLFDLLGTEGQANNRVASGGDEDAGAEVIFAENTVYLFEVWNRDPDTPTRYSSYTTWYEGPLDMPL